MLTLAATNSSPAPVFAQTIQPLSLTNTLKMTLLMMLQITTKAAIPLPAISLQTLGRSGRLGDIQNHKFSDTA
jgi:hypothetical protein